MKEVVFCKNEPKGRRLGGEFIWQGRIMGPATKKGNGVKPLP